ncbi:type I polyketide synthase [Xanthobacter agilis]|uniref:Acyl transferase domain-containing protein/acyl carrier protein/short-subunit dehydrogenase n=1 Tax=Xanthobacter agilis TaxID=47492 RepID=A0ABU0LCM3_XANAG|nr:type I polyketide synthase [Xanthobacter agilis]MDQ0504875.1 acyl transferase domain-containing protein/acyl carrier protein/short-subunit dehydrogenase [Xanthobacter agilis]
MTNRISRAQTPMPETGSTHVATILGYACRLPGAANVDAFWSLLSEGRCAVTEISPNRWAKERFLHPRSGEPGRTYTFAAGVLDNIYDFDAGAFGLSPREVEQVDPQQRILLELTREAFEHANLPLSEVEGKSVGVFVGASSLDYSVRFAADVCSIDPHFVTGNALSIISNRISFAFGFTGPSLTIDTACSSSLVAFDRAVRAIESGEVEVAVVAGVNILASPYNFVGFARAGMLSPTGRCRPFSAQADGYVRSEGAVAMVLRRLDATRGTLQPPRAVVLGTGTNSDGRTVGIALPNTSAQQALIETVYAARGIDPDALAFVEAHGTGTRVGDPAEANAIGNAIGRRRSAPLPIGSVKSNLGHLEPASGLAGLLKSLLALDHRVLPASLHLDEVNESIPFDALNLSPAQAPVPLPEGANAAAVSSFGFGGTNAHAVVRLPQASEIDAPAVADDATLPAALALSATSRKALAELADAYAQAIEAGADAATLANATAHGRAPLAHRLALPLDTGMPLAPALRRFAEDQPEPGIVNGVCDRAARVAFVFAGNGGQYVGMGRTAHVKNAAFRDSIARIDGFFMPRAGWSIAEALETPADQDRVAATEVAQPLLFAIGVALAESLMAYGCQPSAVLGHSVGEIPAAYISGALDLKDAVDVIYWRSKLQEPARGTGTMAVLMASKADANALIAASDAPGMVVAAVNSPSVVTIAGPRAELEALLRRARKNGIAGKRMDLDYPFHSPLMAPVEAPLREALKGLSPRAGSIPFFSTVTGALIDTSGLDGEYWWHNVREPVLFADAVVSAAEREKIDIFLEMGPRPVLTGHMRETLEPLSGSHVVLGSLQEKAPSHRDPVLHTLLSCFVEGAPVARDTLFGTPRPLGGVQLPLTPWQRQTILVPDTIEAADVGGSHRVHPLLGARLRQDSQEWHGLVDPQIVPYLADHQVNDTVVVPAAALAEMALAAGREIHGDVPLALEEFDILHALALGDEGGRESLVRVSPTGLVEILSRPRLTTDWTLNARGHLAPSASSPTGRPPADEPADAPVLPMTADDLYAAADRMGLHYGPQFRLVTEATKRGRTITLELMGEHADQGAFGGRHVLHPTVLDACLHGLLLAVDPASLDDGRVYLPARFGALHVFSTAPVARAELLVVRSSARSLLLDIRLLDAEGGLVARLDGARLRAATLSNMAEAETDYRQHVEALPAAVADIAVVEQVEAAFSGLDDSADAGDAFILLNAFSTALAHEAVTGLLKGETTQLAAVNADDLVERGILADDARPTLLALLAILASGGLAAREGQVWTVAADSGLPDSASILAEVLRDAPERAAEVTLGAYLADALPSHLAKGAPLRLTGALLEHWETAAPGARALQNTAFALVSDLKSDLDRATPARVLVVERTGVLALALLPLAQSGRIRLAVDGVDATSREALAARHPALAPLLAPAATDDGAEARYDVVIVGDPRPLVLETEGLAARLAKRVSGGGLLAVLQMESHPLAALITAAADPQKDGASALRPMSETAQRLASTGLLGVKTRRCVRPEAAVDVLLARVPLPDTDTPAAEAALAEALALEFGHSAAAATLIIAIDGSGHVAALHRVEAAGPLWSDLLAGSGDHRTLVVHPLIPATADPAALAALFTRTTALLEAVRAHAGKAEVWGLTRGGAPVAGTPLASACWGYGRVAINEFADLDLRLVDVAPELDADTAAGRLTALLLTAPDERELVIGAGPVGAVRTSTGTAARQASLPVGEATTTMSRLVSRPGSMDRLTWVGAPRAHVAADAVEIEVAASALNFRDVMFAQGVIGDEMLENGFTGPSLGFECSGVVSRVGSGVTGVKVGDRVMAFAPAAFASHVVVAASMAMPVPDNVPLKAAATIPVAFLTAWYGLVTQARLKRGEWVLVHGAAGGVGLAALQIAKWLGARIVATAGTPEKRALATLAGADLVLDSRSLAFVDDIRAAIGGVDVVLNSLAGEAMERSISVLKPFGRFVELGKRDYIGNTEIGLRPFARNLSYFGVDTDQLIAARPDALQDLFGDLVRLLADGTFTPLPYREFAADSAPEAFRLMQGAGHVGKILLTPPAAPPPVAETPAPFRAAPDGVHLVVGGTGGFGFETAMWLADHGATAIVAASRSGTLTPDAAARAAALAARGVTLTSESLDVRDAGAVQRFVDGLVARYGRLSGVVHAAMVLDDGLLRDLSAARFEKVLAPKIEGASHLDAATRTLKPEAAPDYFVMFSSATTLVGNPGQGNYVAANAFLEGLARDRRAAGLPALAVSWGAISDVGVLARETAINEKLKRRIGRHAMASATALKHLGAFLSEGDAIHPPAVTCAYIDWSTAGELALVKAPTFTGLLTDGRGERTLGKSSDLESLISGQSDHEARLTIARLLAEEIGKILRLPLEAVDLTRPLMDIGMDSLMSLELDMEVQRRFGVELPVLALGAGSTLMDVADKVLQQVRGSAEATGSSAEQVIAEAGIMDKHVDLDLDKDAIARLSAKVVSEREHASGGIL